ncbi:MAG: hypothetical protein GX259_09085 [Bacteroidales bacterium]|jgi:hypothetical protein|nr:hypothetical protein [Bacteroidales bacterium]
MKNILIVLLLLSSIALFGQEMPSDSLILKTIYGKTDIGGESYTCEYLGENIVSSYQDSLVFQIVFKSEVNLNNNDYILAILKARYGTQHGHQFGYEDLYFLKTVQGELELVDSIKSEFGVIGDESIYDIVDIGKNKKALISTFQSIGNQQFYRTESIQLLELNKLMNLFSVEKYSDLAWNLPASENDDCNATSYEETFEIVTNDSDWYDIKVHRVEYGFTKGCEDSFVISESDKEYKYINGEYVEKTNE